MAPERTSTGQWLLRFARGGGLHSLATQFYIVTAVLAFAALILMNFALSSLKASRIQSEATEDTLLEITTIEARLLESDRMLSAHAISGAPRFSRGFEQSERDIRSATNKLKRSIENDPALMEKFQVIADRLEKRQTVFKYLTQPQHLSEVAHLERSTTARAEHDLTEEIRAKIWDLLRAERAKRFSQHTDMIHEANKNFLITVAIVILTLLSGAANLLLAYAGGRDRRVDRA